MTDNVREAAERLRDAIKGNSTFRVGDLAAVTLQYLAEHPADNDEPVTVEWLASVGFTIDVHQSVKVTADLFLVYRGGGWFLASGADTIKSAAVDLPDYKTRSDVRRLCAALGIELNESGE